MSATTGNLAQAKVKKHKRDDSLARKFFRRPTSIIYTVLLVVIILACYIGPNFLVAPASAQFDPLMGPSAQHIMGTDSLGRDMFSRVLTGGQTSLLVGAAVAVLCLTIAVIIGGLAGFYGGVVDTILTKITEFFQVIPAIILALVAAAILGANTTVIILILSFTMWPQVARIVRADAMRISELGYVESDRAVGFGSLRIFWTDVLPNAFAPVLVATTMTIGRAILAESALAFLGLGDANKPSWGGLLNSAQSHMQTAPWLTLFPGLMIFLVVLSTNMLGDQLNDSLNPTLSRVK